LRAAIQRLRTAADEAPGGSTLDQARHACDVVLPAMDAVRAAADALEEIVADDLWPLPTYQEMFFILRAARWAVVVARGTGRLISRVRSVGTCDSRAHRERNGTGSGTEGRCSVPHQVWRGAIVFGLVNVPVKAFPAVRDHKVRFHQIDRKTGSRIGYEKVAKSTGEPVAKEDIELGYELETGEYVTFRKEEVDALRPSSTRSVDIVQFVDLAAIDPVFYERTYWLAPADETAARAYRLLTAAMESEQRVGI